MREIISSELVPLMEDVGISMKRNASMEIVIRLFISRGLPRT